MTAMQEVKGLNTMSLDALIESLKTHEINSLRHMKMCPRKRKNMALKSLQKTIRLSIDFVVVKDSDNEEAPKEDDEEDDKVACLIRKINKVWNKRSKGKKRHM